jgi:hypothetical protein
MVACELPTRHRPGLMAHLSNFLTIVNQAGWEECATLRVL